MLFVILLFIITFLLAIVFFILIVFGRFISGILSLFRGNKSQRQAGGFGSRSRYDKESNSEETQNKGESNKIFSKEEGEYVSYEEIE